MRKIRSFFTMLKECVVMSLSNIMHNRMRSFLTMLGIMIGVMAVIALITTVNGVTGSLTSSLSSMGAGTVTLMVTGNDLKSGLTTDDLTTLTDLDEVVGVTPSVSLSRARVSRGGNYESNISVSGKNSYFFLTNEDVVTRGRALNFIDEDNMSFVCLIDQDMVEEFFYGEDPVGQNLYINGVPFLVVGIFGEDDTGTVASLLSGTSDIYIPYTTCMKMNNENLITSMTVYLADNVDSTTGSTALENVLDPMFSYEDDTYTITTMDSIEDTLETMTTMMSTLLAGIASIALLVGGIGIMNMMLTTVTERTTEIGLKKALGAIPWQIQIQFLIESFLLSMIGGLIGVGFGILLSFILAQVMGTDFVISTGAIALGVGFSAAVGIIFGWAPARKASKLNPIDALRSV